MTEKDSSTPHSVRAADAATADESAEIRQIVGDTLHEPVPDAMTTVEAVRTMARYVEHYRRQWGKCHERHVVAEALLRADESPDRGATATPAEGGTSEATESEAVT